MDHSATAEAVTDRVDHRDDTAHRVIGPPPSHILEEEVSGEMVLYDPEQKIFVSLNATAADVWRLATGEHSIDDLVDLVSAAYEVAAEEVRDQVADAVQELIEAGLLPPQT